MNYQKRIERSLMINTRYIKTIWMVFLSVGVVVLAWNQQQIVLPGLYMERTGMGLLQKGFQTPNTNGFMAILLTIVVVVLIMFHRERNQQAIGRIKRRKDFIQVPQNLNAQGYTVDVRLLRHNGTAKV